MDQNLSSTTPEPEPMPEFKPEPTFEPRAVLVPERVVVSEPVPAQKPIVESKPALAPEPVKTFSSGIISLTLGLITWVFTFFSGLLDINFFFAGIIAFISAILAIFFGARAKRENPASTAGKVGRFLGWLYIIAGLAIIVGLILGVSAIVGLFS